MIEQQATCRKAGVAHVENRDSRSIRDRFMQERAPGLGDRLRAPAFVTGI
jgi:hypothetical protein